MTKSALILIDIQNDYFPDFDGAKMPLPNMNAASKNAATLLATARKDATEIVHIQHLAEPTTGPFFHIGTPGSEIHSDVTPLAGEIIIEKTRPSSFFATNLEAHLRENNVDHLVICGAMSQMCIDATTRAAVDLGFKATVAHDACAAANLSHDGIDVPANMVHASMMAALAFGYASVLPTSEIA